ncbi:MAG: hypothetical protein LBU42_09730 [Prevotellaceae bacterium]|jgi:hypothetical protein|nr:hypothetical protein [Prevotellaceae bacterium]
MKKIFSSLFFPLWGIGGLFAQATVTPISVDYDRHEVKFRIAWNAATAANNRVWVFVDLCPVAKTAPGTFAKAVISGATATAGSIDPASLNGRGFYVTTNPSTVTASLSNATGKFNWCAYGSDYPPNAKYDGSGGYTLRGTPPFIVTTSSGTTEVNATTYSGGEITALTDATGCPGARCGKNGESSGLANCCDFGTVNCAGICTNNCFNCEGCALLKLGEYIYSAWLDLPGQKWCTILTSKPVCDGNVRKYYVFKIHTWDGNKWVYSTSYAIETDFGRYECCD